MSRCLISLAAGIALDAKADAANEENDHHNDEDDSSESISLRDLPESSLVGEGLVFIKRIRGAEELDLASTTFHCTSEKIVIICA